MAQPDQAVDVGRHLELAETDALDAAAVRPHEHPVLRALHRDPHHFDSQGRVEILADAENGGHSAHQAVALGVEGDHAAAGSGLFEDAEIADDGAVAQEKRAGVAVLLDGRRHLVAPIGIGVVDLVSSADAENHRCVRRCDPPAPRRCRGLRRWRRAGRAPGHGRRRRTGRATGGRVRRTACRSRRRPPLPRSDGRPASAISVRGQGHWPSRERLCSSMSTMVTRGAAIEAVWLRCRRSKACSLRVSSGCGSSSLKPSARARRIEAWSRGLLQSLAQASANTAPALPPCRFSDRARSSWRLVGTARVHGVTVTVMVTVSLPPLPSET